MGCEVGKQKKPDNYRGKSYDGTTSLPKKEKTEVVELPSEQEKLESKFGSTSLSGLKKYKDEVRPERDERGSGVLKKRPSSESRIRKNSQDAVE